jgi:hypothetical protein
MRIHSRDKRKWFGANFGRNYFVSAPVINPSFALGLCMPIAAILFVCAVAWLAHSGDSGMMLMAAGPILSIQELRTKGAKAASDAETFYRDNKDSWNTEKQSQFEAMVKDSTDAQKEIQGIETREQQALQMHGLTEYFNAPVNRIQAPAVETHGAPSITEAFSRYVKGDKSLPKESLEACKNIHREAFMAYVRGDVSGMTSFMLQNNLSPREAHALVSSDNTLGGFLCMTTCARKSSKPKPVCRSRASVPRRADQRKRPGNAVKAHATDVRRAAASAASFRRKAIVTSGTAPTAQNQPVPARANTVHSWRPDAVELGKELMEDSGATWKTSSPGRSPNAAFDKDDRFFRDRREPRRNFERWHRHG